MAEPDVFGQIGELLRQASEPGRVPTPGTPGIEQPLPQRIENVVTLLPAFAIVYLAAVLTVAGLALLWFLLAPERSRRGVQLMARTPISSWLIGMGAAIVVVALSWALSAAGLHRAVGPLGLLLLVMAAIGLSVCARFLGERVLPERGPVAQVVLGLVGLALPCLFVPFCFLVLWIAGPVGFGAWLRARRAPG